MCALMFAYLESHETPHVSEVELRPGGGAEHFRSIISVHEIERSEFGRILGILKFRAADYRKIALSVNAESVTVSNIFDLDYNSDFSMGSALGRGGHYTRKT
jgi:hypothetical protein